MVLGYVTSSEGENEEKSIQMLSSLSTRRLCLLDAYYAFLDSTSSVMSSLLNSMRAIHSFIVSCCAQSGKHYKQEGTKCGRELRGRTRKRISAIFNSVGFLLRNFV